MGDMNAVLHASDRASGTGDTSADIQYQQFIRDSRLVPATEATDSSLRAFTYLSGTTIASRIDDILTLQDDCPGGLGSVPHGLELTVDIGGSDHSYLQGTWSMQSLGLFDPPVLEPPSFATPHLNHPRFRTPFNRDELSRYTAKVTLVAEPATRTLQDLLQRVELTIDTPGGTTAERMLDADLARQLTLIETGITDLLSTSDQIAVDSCQQLPTAPGTGKRMQFPLYLPRGKYRQMTELLGHVAIINGVLRLYVRHKDEDDMPQCPALIHTFRDHPLLRRAARADLRIAPASW